MRWLNLFFPLVLLFGFFTQGFCQRPYQKIDELTERARSLNIHSYFDSALHVGTQALQQAKQLNYSKGMAQAQYEIAQASFRLSLYKESLEAARQSLVLFKETGDYRGQVLSTLLFSYYSLNMGRYDSAAYFANAASKLAEHAHDREALAHVNLAYGNLYITNGDFGTASQKLLSARKTFDSLHNDYEVARVDIALVDSYVNLGETQRAKQLLKSPIHYFVSENNHGRLAAAYNSLSGIYVSEDKYDSSIYFLKRAQKGFHRANDEYGEGIVLYNIGESYFNLHQFDSSLHYYRLSNDIAKKVQDTDGQIYNLLGMANTAFSMGKYKLVEDYLAGIEEFSSYRKNPELFLPIYRLHAKLDSTKGDFKKALAWHQQYAYAMDTFNDVARKKLLAEMHTRFETEQKDKAIQLLTIEKESTESRIRLQRIIGITIGTAVLLFIAGLIYSMKQRKRNFEIVKTQRDYILHANERLAKQNEQLLELHEEKDRLIGIVAHDLRSPLRKTLGLVTLLGMEGPLNPSQTELITLLTKVNKQGDELVSELLNIHELESQHAPAGLEKIKLDTVLLSAVENWKQVAAEKKIDIHVQSISPQDIQANTNYLNRIFDNLISNAIKYSNPDTTITITHEEKNITITDKGLGMSADDLEMLFKKFSRLSARPTAGESSSGLGLYIVKMLMDRMDSPLTVESILGQGTSFRLHFK